MYMIHVWPGQPRLNGVGEPNRRNREPQPGGRGGDIRHSTYTVLYGTRLTTLETYSVSVGQRQRRFPLAFTGYLPRTG